MLKIFARFKKDESGATAIEYGLIAALIGVAIIVGAGSLGATLNKKFDSIATTVSGASTTATTGAAKN
ncbi:MAG: Flp family type IVb pilin [Methylobacterium mesophilicum]|nr:Flp family type IVb pilin [Methylobacterium mesophilicum]